MSEVIWIEDAGELRDLIDTEPEVVVDFSAPAWCRPCVQFAPVFDAVAERVDATFVAVDIDKAPWAVEEYGVRGVPNVKLFRNGQYVTDLAKTPADRTAIRFMNEINNA